jgi:hypothetical protein
MSGAVKAIVIAAILSAVFFSGWRVSSLRWEARFSEYKRQEAEATLAKQKEYEAERGRLESAAARLRADLDNRSADTDGLRQQVAVWKGRAKSAESKLAIQCLGVVAEERKLREEGEAIIRFCQAALPDRGGESGNSRGKQEENTN